MQNFYKNWTEDVFSHFYKFDLLSLSACWKPAVKFAAFCALVSPSSLNQAYPYSLFVTSLYYEIVCDFMQNIKIFFFRKPRLKLTCFLHLSSRERLTTERRKVAWVEIVCFFQVHALGRSIWVEFIKTCTHVTSALWFGASCFTSLKKWITQNTMRQVLMLQAKIRGRLWNVFLLVSQIYDSVV